MEGEDDPTLKSELLNKLYEYGKPTKRGLPSVIKANPDNKPSRLGGLQPRNAASSQTLMHTNQNLLSKNKSALISGASRAIQDVIDRRVIEQEEKLQQLTHRSKTNMFQSIDEVQMQTIDPYYEELDEGEYGTTPRHLGSLEHATTSGGY